MKTDREQSCMLDLREEEWVDWLLGKQTAVATADMAEHLSVCPTCREQVEWWKSILSIEVSHKEAAQTPEGLLPSDRVRASLHAHIRRRAMIQRMRSGWTSRSKWAAGIAAAAVILVCAIALYGNVRQPVDQRNAYVASHEPAAMSFIHAPETASYKVHPYNDELGEGYVWYNGDSSEMLVLLDGLISTQDYVIQAWALDHDSRTNLGVLMHSEKKLAHLYVKGAVLANASQLALTIEPNGGSDSPTSPDVFVFRLER